MSKDFLMLQLFEDRFSWYFNEFHAAQPTPVVAAAAAAAPRQRWPKKKNDRLLPRSVRFLVVPLFSLNYLVFSPFRERERERSEMEWERERHLGLMCIPTTWSPLMSECGEASKSRAGSRSSQRPSKRNSKLSTALASATTKRGQDGTKQRPTIKRRPLGSIGRIVITKLAGRVVCCRFGAAM